MILISKILFSVGHEQRRSLPLRCRMVHRIPDGWKGKRDAFDRMLVLLSAHINDSFLTIEIDVVCSQLKRYYLPVKNACLSANNKYLRTVKLSKRYSSESN